MTGPRPLPGELLAHGPPDDLARPLLLATAVAALLLVGAPALWRRTRHVVTIAHEGAHDRLAGGELGGVELGGRVVGLQDAAALPGGPTVLGCFHVSQQNTFTGKLTEAMFDAVLVQARARAGL